MMCNLKSRRLTVPGFFLYLHNKNQEAVNKMQWLVDAFVNDRLDSTFKFRISESKKDYGTICMPTGTGKSGVMIEDILRRIRHACNNNIIINISCPTLKLLQQLVADLFETLDGILTTVCYEKDVRLGKERFALALNSSDSPYNYNTYGCNIYSGTELKSVIATAFGEQKKVIVVASCHKSLQKFVSITDDILAFSPDDTYIYNYIDESHLIPYDSWYTGDEMERVNLSKLKSNSSALYLFSATPDYNMTMELTDCVDNPYIYKMYPIDAINDNIILPPRIRTKRPIATAKTPCASTMPSNFFWAANGTMKRRAIPSASGEAKSWA
ncbi:MAG: DEAD/DEAH box helicase family protein [Clostridia bacterium]|nr:DEAD/DEAH box helicase family protein [Clostridia bacterium]